MGRGWWLLGLAVFLPGCAKENPMDLRCTLEIAASLPAGAPATLTFRLENAGSDPVSLLPWQTPLEGIKAPMLSISHDRQMLAYQGPMVKRAAPGPDAYITLAPGETREAQVDIGLAWDLEAPGPYWLRYDGGLMDVRRGAPPARGDVLQPAPLVCNDLKFMRENP